MATNCSEFPPSRFSVLSLHFLSRNCTATEQPLHSRSLVAVRALFAAPFKQLIMNSRPRNPYALPVAVGASVFAAWYMYQRARTLPEHNANIMEASDRSADLAAGIRDTARNRTVEEAQKVQDKANQMVVKKDNSQKGAEKGVSLFKWSAAKVIAVEKEAEHALENAENKIVDKTSEMKDDVLSKANNVKDRTKEATHGWSTTTHEECTKTKEMMKDKANSTIRKSPYSPSSVLEGVTIRSQDVPDSASLRARTNEPGRSLPRTRPGHRHIEHSVPDAINAHDPVYDGTQDPAGYSIDEDETPHAAERPGRARDRAHGRFEILHIEHIEHSVPDPINAHDPISDGTQDPVGYSIDEASFEAERAPAVTENARSRTSERPTPWFTPTYSPRTVLEGVTIRPQDVPDSSEPRVCAKEPVRPPPRARPESMHIEHSIPDAINAHDPVYDGTQDPVGYSIDDEGTE
jgi:hypothetical protein